MKQKFLDFFGTVRTLEGSLWLTLGITLGFLDVIGLLPVVSMVLIMVGGWKVLTKDKL